MNSPFKSHAHNAGLTPDDHVDEVIIEEAEDGDNKSRFSAVPAWLTSFGMHGMLVAVMAAMVWGVQKEEELPPYRMNILPDVPKQIEDKKTAIKPSELEIKVTDVEVTVESPITLVEPVDLETNQEALVPDDGNPGRSDAVANVEVGSQGAFMAIGANSGGSGLYSNRIGIGKKRTSAKFTSSQCRTSSIHSALRWFKRHQSANGMWDVDNYQNNCMDGGAKCEPGENQKGDADIACSAYALMCYIGMGYDHKTPGPYIKTIDKAVTWLLSQQQDNGLFGQRNYEHAIATMALAELFGISNDMRLKEPCQKAVNVILSRQAIDPSAKDQAYAGLGWDYINPNAKRNDTSVTGWNVMALKSALGAGLQVGHGLEGSKVWLEKAWKASNPNWQNLDPYKDESVFPYTYDATTDTAGNHGDNKGKLACVGAICAVFLGHFEGDPMLDTFCNYIMKHDFPTKYPTNTYYLYYNTMAIFQSGKKNWEKWDNHVAELLANAQRKDDNCFNGSWDYEGTGFHGHNTGRLLSTAYACLSQEVIWRYTQVKSAQQH